MVEFCLATPAEVIDHYYYFLMDNLDNNTICQLLLKLELIAEEDVINSARMYSEYQQNSFLLDRLLTSYTSSIVKFCHMLQHMENNQEIGKMLVYGKDMNYRYICSIVIFVNHSNGITIH